MNGIYEKFEITQSHGFEFQSFDLIIFVHLGMFQNALYLSLLSPWAGAAGKTRAK